MQKKKEVVIDMRMTKKKKYLLMMLFTMNQTMNKLNMQGLNRISLSSGGDGDGNSLARIAMALLKIAFVQHRRED